MEASTFSTELLLVTPGDYTYTGFVKS